MRFLDCADSALLVELDGEVDPVLLGDALRGARLEGTGACIPGLSSVLVEYDCLVVDHRVLVGRIEGVAAGLGEGGPGLEPTRPRQMVLPVCFEASVAPDLEEVARRVGLTADAVIQVLTGSELRVALVGHLPGLPYLCGLPARFALPRRASPRTGVPAGAVGVAAGMACVYPSAAPGGWHLVGQSPAPLWDATADPPALLRAGDLVRLVAVPKYALEAIGSGGPAGCEVS